MTLHPRPAGRILRSAGTLLLRALAFAGAPPAAACHEPAPSTPAAASRVLWAVPVPDMVQSVPAAADGRVFVAGDSGVAAYEQADGTLAWRVRAPGAGAGRAVLYRDGRLFTAGVDGARAYDAGSGALAWAHPLAGDASPDFATAAVDGRALIVGTRDRRVLALSEGDGFTLWEARLDSAGWAFGGVVSGVALSADTVYAAARRFQDDRYYAQSLVLVALDRLTGRELWRRQVDGLTSGPASAPAVAGRLLTIGTTGGQLLAVDRFTGQQAWTQTFGGQVNAAPAVAGGRLYLGLSDAWAQALDPATGASAWRTRLPAGAWSWAVCGGELLLNTQGVQVVSLATGAREATAVAATDTAFVPAGSGFAVSGTRAFVGGSARLYALRCD